MLSKIVEQEVYSRLSDQEKEYYKRVIVPSRRRTSALLGGIALTGGVSSAYMHFAPEDKKKRILHDFGDKKKYFAGAAITSGVGALALTAKGPIRDFHDYQSYKRYCKRRGQVPMSISEFRKEIKNIK